MEQHSNKRLLFQKFLNDQCDEQEIDLLIYILQNEADIDDLPEFDEVYLKLNQEPRINQEKSDLIFQKILKRKNISVSGQRNIQNIHWLKAAASVCLFLIATFFIYQYFTKDQPTTYSTNFGEVRSILLQDGTEVLLNANSQLSLQQGWNKTQDRVVKLKGEAFFKVTHTDQHQRFIVDTEEGMRVVVLGTEFNVNSRDKTSHVTLRSGRVQISVSSEDVLMEPGEMVSYQKVNSNLLKKSVDTELYTSWTKNILLFKENKLSEVAQVLKVNFGYRVVFENDSLSNLLFTGSNPADEPDLLLHTIEKSFSLNIMKQDNIIYIRD